MRTFVQKPNPLPRPAVSSQIRTKWGPVSSHAAESPDVGARFGHDFGLLRVNADAPGVSGVLQRAPADPVPADPSAELARVRRALEDAKDVAADLVEETTGRPVNTGRGGGRRARATRQRTAQILAELESIANNPAVPEAQRAAATRLHGEIEDLSSEARAAEVERARAAGAPKAAERARERASGKPKAEFKAAKVEGKGTTAAVKTTTTTTSAAKVESVVASTVSADAKAAARASRLAKLGSMGFQLLLPGPLDAIALMIQFAGSYAEAREAIRDRNTRTGFAIGLSAFLLGRSHGAVRKHLTRKFVLDRDVHTQIVGAVGVAERAHNSGLDAGFNYGSILSDDAKDVLLDIGLSILLEQGRLPATRDHLFSAEGVWRLAGALREAVDQIFEAMRVQAERQRQEERRQRRQEEYRIGNKI